MRNFYLLPITCAVALISACSSAPVKQEIVVPPPPPPVVEPVAPPPVVLKKIEPDISAPYYRLNPLNYTAPLNPVLVSEIRDLLTPKMVNIKTGEIVVKLPLEVPGEVTPTAVVATTSPAVSPPLVVADSATAPIVGDTNSATAIPVQDVQTALLKIDPSLKLNEQAANSQTTPVSTTPEQANVTTQPVEAANPLLKILIPKHSANLVKQRFAPAATDEEIDVSDIDRDLVLIEGKARHYPTKFINKQERLKAESRIKEMTKQLDILSVDPRASYEVLLRAMKAHVLARNMDAGPDSAFKSAVYFQRLLKLKPNDPETSFWYGFSLGEGGGFKESIPHLNNALKANYQEAYLALAHSYLQMEDKKNALTMLNNYKVKFPDNAAGTDQLITEIQDGKRYSIWQ